MKKPPTLDEVLAGLAAKGDPAAHFIMMGDRARTLYTTARDAGNSHREAIDHLMPFFGKVYRHFIRLGSGRNLDEWFDRQERRYLKAKSKRDTGTVYLEKYTDEELKDFNLELQRTFQREYSQLKESVKNRSRLLRARLYILQHTPLRIAVDILLIACVVAAAEVYMIYTDTGVTLSIRMTDRKLEVSLPSMLRNCPPFSKLPHGVLGRLSARYFLATRAAVPAVQKELPVKKDSSAVNAVPAASRTAAPEAAVAVPGATLPAQKPIPPRIVAPSNPSATVAPAYSADSTLVP